MNLADPSWLLLLILPCVLAIGAWIIGRRNRSQWHKIVAPRLISKLFQPRPAWRRWSSITCGLLGLCMVIIVFCQPNVGEEEQDAQVRGRNILIAMDVSRSMLVKDVPPSRLDAAKIASLEIIDQLPSDRIGIIAFAGNAFLQAPLTLDHAALRDTLDQLNHGVIPVGGSNFTAVIEEAAATFDETGQESHALVILSDGEGHEELSTEAIQLAKETGILIVSIAIGSEEGQLIPDPDQQDGVYRDRDGSPVVSSLNPETLKALATETNGRYIQGTGRDFTNQLRDALQHIEEYDLGVSQQKKLITRYQHFLIPALLLFLANLLCAYFLVMPAKKKSA